jgi:hypothetical protein
LPLYGWILIGLGAWALLSVPVALGVGRWIKATRRVWLVLILRRPPVAQKTQPRRRASVK